MPFFCCFPSSASKSSRRKSSSPSFKRSSFQTATKNLTKIFEELKCPVCFNICVPPIHNCVNGHIICNACRLKGHVTTCPTCRQSLSSGARNMFAENFVLNYAQQCFYASQGCEHLRLKGCSMKSHEEKCMFRPIKCIVGTCGLHIPYKNFLAHLDCGHKASGSDQLPTQIQFKYNPKKKGGRKWLPYYIQAFDNVYYVMMQRKRKVFWVWVYSQLAKESDDLEYSYSAYIKLRHPEKKISVSWHGPVYSIRTPFKIIYKEGCAFTLSSTLVNSFCVGGNLTFWLDIKKVARRTLKGVKLPGEGDSETAVVSSGGLPQEYNRPPSFYEPSILSSQQSPAAQDFRGTTPSLPNQNNNNEQGTIIAGSLEENGRGNHQRQFSPLSGGGASVVMFQMKPQNVSPPASPPTPPKRKTPRTAAIGIPSFIPPPPPSESPTVTSFLDTVDPPLEIPDTANNANNSNDEAGDDDGFGDKIAVKDCRSTSSDLQKHFYYFDYSSN